jgi:hypothetical protein
MPMLKVADFKGGTPEVIKTSYAVLVLVPPMQVTETGDVRQELEIVEVVADQVVVPLSHASLPEESQAMRKTLAEQNHELVQARRDAHMAKTRYREGSAWFFSPQDPPPSSCCRALKGRYLQGDTAWIRIRRSGYRVAGYDVSSTSCPTLDTPRVFGSFNLCTVYPKPSVRVFLFPVTQPPP